MATNINPGELDSSFGLTDTELKAAMQLFLLSESSATAPEDKISCSSFSATSSPRSVNNARQVPYHFVPLSIPFPEDEADDDDDGPWRPDKRYRLVSDVYAETSPVITGGRDKKAKRTDCRRKVKGERMIGRISQFCN